MEQTHIAERLKKFFRAHGLVLALACVVGALSVAPALLAVKSLGSEYKGIPFLYLDDEDYYIARMQEIVDGHPSVGSPFLYEYKNSFSTQPPTGEQVYVILSRLTRLDLLQVVVLAKFLFPAILFLLVFSLATRLSPKDDTRLRLLGGIAAGLLVTLGYELLSPAAMLQIILGHGTLQLSIWTRPVNPILGALALFAYLLAVWEMDEDRRGWLWLPAGIILGFSTLYFFSWGVAMSVTGILVLCRVVQKEWMRLARLALVFGVSLVVSAPYWASTLHSVGGEAGKILALRNGMFFTHAPLLNKTLLAALVVFAVASFILARRDTWRRLVCERWWIFCLALLCGGLWALNQQVLTGREIWPYHFVQYTKPFVSLALVILLVRVSQRARRVAWWLCLVVIGYTFVQAIISIQGYRAVLPEFRTVQQEAPVYAWLKMHAPTDCVVLVHEASFYLSRRIPAFTSCNTYVTSWVFYGVSESRMRHNFFVYLRMQGVASADVKDYLLSHPELVRSFFFDDWHTMFGTETNAWVERTVSMLVPDYVDFMRHDFSEELRSERIDYVLSDGSLDEQIKKEYGVRVEVLRSGNLILYSL